jgi:hypothetical protein
VAIGQAGFWLVKGKEKGGVNHEEVVAQIEEGMR